jgi:hypothetical protein
MKQSGVFVAALAVVLATFFTARAAGWFAAPVPQEDAAAARVSDAERWYRSAHARHWRALVLAPR